MLEIHQNFEAHADDLVAFSSLYVHDKADPARIVLIPRVIETLSFGYARHQYLSVPTWIRTERRVSEPRISGHLDQLLSMTDPGHEGDDFRPKPSPCGPAQATLRQTHPKKEIVTL
jgi:hypothetical protein